MTATTERVERMPDMGGLYARAALGAVSPFDHEGDALPETRLECADVVVDTDRVRRYADVCGFRLRAQLPSTLVHVVGFPLQVALFTRGDFPFDLPGMVHVRQSIDQRRAVEVGEPMTMRAWVGDLRPHRAGLQFDAHLEAEVDGEVCWQGTSTYLRRGEGKDDDAPPEGPDVDLDRAPTGVEIAVPEDVGRRYAGVSGDRNPIHLHSVTARAFGFPRAIAHGMWSMARVLAVMEGRVPDAHRFEVRFEKPVLLPTTTVLSTHRVRADAWDVALHDHRKDVRHLVGTLRGA